MPKTNKRVAEPLTTLVVLRKQLDLRQKEFADKVSCSLDTIKSLEQGRLKLSATLAMKIYEATGIDTRWLIANDPEKPPVAFWKAEPYTKAIYDAVQGAKNQPEGYIVEVQEDVVLRRLGELLAVLNAAQRKSRESAYVVHHRISEFVERLIKEFPVDMRRYSKEAVWPALDEPEVNLLELKIAEFRKRATPLWMPGKSTRRTKTGGRKK